VTLDEGAVGFFLRVEEGWTTRRMRISQKALRC
jgi:hypothetical protein